MEVVPIMNTLLYGDNIFESNDIVFTNEEFEMILNALKEVSEENEVLEEGANVEITKAFITHKKAYIKEMRLAKKNLYNKEEALEHIKNAKKEIKECKKVIKGTDSNVGSTVFGIIANALMDMCDVMLPNSIAKMGINFATSGASNTIISTAKFAVGKDVAEKAFQVSYIKGVIVLMREIMGTMEAVRDEKRSKVDKFNMYKNKMLTYVADLEARVDKFEKYVKNRKW